MFSNLRITPSLSSTHFLNSTTTRSKTRCQPNSTTLSTTQLLNTTTTFSSTRQQTNLTTLSKARCRLNATTISTLYQPTPSQSGLETLKSQMTSHDIPTVIGTITL